jgi:hypothetical protein
MLPIMAADVVAIAVGAMGDLILPAGRGRFHPLDCRNQHDRCERTAGCSCRAPPRMRPSEPHFPLCLGPVSLRHLIIGLLRPMHRRDR